MKELENIYKRLRKLKCWKLELEGTPIEEISVIFTVIFIKIMNLRSNSRGQKDYLEKFGVTDFPRDKIAHIRDDLIKKQGISFDDGALLRKFFTKYFENRNNGLFDIERVSKGIKLLEQMKCVEIDGVESDWNIEKWSAPEIGNVILETWNRSYKRYEKYVEGKEEDKISVSIDLNKISKEDENYHLPTTSTFMEDFSKKLDLIRNVDLDRSKEKVDTIFDEYIMKYCTSERLLKFTDTEYYQLLHAAYLSADIFDKVHDSKSYILQVNLINSINRKFFDDYSNIDDDILRKIIGLTYGIAICPVDKQSNELNIGLSYNKNLIIKEGNQTKKNRLDCCLTAMESISSNKSLGIVIDEDGESEILKNIYYKRVKVQLKKKDFALDELKRLELVGLYYSDLAAIHMNYLITEKNPSFEDLEKHSKLAMANHINAIYVRDLLCCCYNNIDKEKEKNMYLSLAKSLSNLASLEYKLKNYGRSLALRISLFEFYHEYRYNKKAAKEADYICNSWNLIEVNSFKEEYSIREKEEIIEKGTYYYNKKIKLENRVLDIKKYKPWRLEIDKCKDCLKWN